MKIAVVCANGKAGKLIVKEAVDRGLDVTAVVRDQNQTAAPKALQKDLFDLTAADLAGYDVVIDAFGAWTEDTLPQHSTSLKHLCDILSGTDTRLLVVGGAGPVCEPGAHRLRGSGVRPPEARAWHSKAGWEAQGDRSRAVPLEQPGPLGGQFPPGDRGTFLCPLYAGGRWR